MIVGPKTTIAFYRKLVEEDEFRKREFDTAYLDRQREFFDDRRKEREEARLAELMAEIYHRKYNPFAL